MKKILIFLLLFSLCGCAKAKSEYLVSSSGFDYKNGQFEVFVEAVVSNSETEEQSLKLIKGCGETVEKAMAEIKKQCTQRLLLSHCAVILVSEDIQSDKLDEIYEFVLNNEDITLSVVFAKTENIEKLFSQKPVSTVSVGYDILSLIESNNKKLKTRYFEIMAQNKKVRLPEIVATKEGYYLES